MTAEVSLTTEGAALTLKRGGVVAFPTETVYGLGADATNDAAVKEIFRLKGRPLSHPVIVHVPDAAQLERWAKNVPAAAWLLAEAFWPGPLTLILERQPWVSDVLTGAQATVGVRVPAHLVALELLERVGGGVAAPSANRFGHISPTTAEHVRAEFGDRVPVLDGGAAAVGLESTILDLTGIPRILRPGAVSAARLEAVLQMPVLQNIVLQSTNLQPEASLREKLPSEQTVPRVSGSLKSHYAPHTPAFLLTDVSQQSRATDAVLSRRPQVSAAHVWLTLPADPEGYAHDFYASLRALDTSGATRILIEAVPDTPVWAAVRDRLTRATTVSATHLEGTHG